MSYYKKLKFFRKTTETTDVRYLPGRILYATRFIIYYMVPWPRELLLIENNIDGGQRVEIGLLYIIFRSLTY